MFNPEQPAEHRLVHDVELGLERAELGSLAAGGLGVVVGNAGARVLVQGEVLLRNALVVVARRRVLVDVAEVDDEARMVLELRDGGVRSDMQLLEHVVDDDDVRVCDEHARVAALAERLELLVQQVSTVSEEGNLEVCAHALALDVDAELARGRLVRVVLALDRREAVDVAAQVLDALSTMYSRSTSGRRT